MWKSPLRSLGVLLLAAAALSGCATSYLLENNVQSFSSLAPPLPSNPAYRFERLPSQQASPVQAQLEALAEPALLRAGLRRNDAAPQYSVQVSARVQRVLSPWADPWTGWGGWGGWGGHFGVMGPGVGFGYGGFFPRMDQPWYQREVGIVMRELPSSRVVYETHAASDGPWGDNASVLPAMFEAALQGFPNAPPGVRRVNIQVGK